MADSTTGPGRFIGPVIAAVIFLGGGVALFFNPASPWLWLLTLVALALLGQGLRDLLQHRHTLLRNYPLLAHFRWFFEFLRPFLRQYIVENDREGRPYNRDMRSLIYERAKDQVDAKPFGSDLDAYDNEFQVVTHSMAPRPKPDTEFRVRVGTGTCARPFDASLLNVSAMSFGSLSGPAVEALNLGARRGGFYQDTGEGGISPYHVRHGGDLVWEIGSGYFGCRDRDGYFDRGLFREQANRDSVRMIEIKLSQGAKPGHGGLLPAAKITEEIARTRKIPVAQDCLSPAYHTAFSTPRELLEFAASLRADSGGKPVGIKLCVGHPWEVFALCKAMLDSGIRVDFIVVDGAEGGPARRRRNSPTMSACRCAKGCCWCATLWWAPACARTSGWRPAARCTAPTPWPPTWRWAPTGATRPGRSCCRWAACRPKAAITICAPPVWRRRTPTGSAVW